jgi:hypothetical protein
MNKLTKTLGVKAIACAMQGDFVLTDFYRSLNRLHWILDIPAWIRYKT